MNLLRMDDTRTAHEAIVAEIKQHSLNLRGLAVGGSDRSDSPVV